MDRYLGKKVKNDITNLYGMVLISAGTQLLNQHIELLKNHDIDPLSMILVSDAEDAYKHSVDKAVQTSEELFQSIGKSQKIPLIEIQEEILPVIQYVSGHSNIFRLFQVVRATDEYTYQHNIGVGILSTLIGKWLNMPEPELSTLSLAATLHDVGKVNVPIEILNKPGKLTEAEYDLIKKHTIYGYEILKHTEGLDRRIPLVALQHHERNDGNGYPLKLKHHQVNYFSKIVAVADIFHAMSSKRPYHDPIPFHEIVSRMRTGLFGELDPNIVSVFLDNMINRLIGETVSLSDGREGEVVYLNPHSRETPLVKVDDEFLDLSRRYDLRIQQVSVQ